MGSASPVRGDVLERAVALRTLGKEWAAIARELGGVTPDQVAAAVRRHNLAAGVSEPTAANLGSDTHQTMVGGHTCEGTSVPLTSASVLGGSSGNYLIIPDPQIPFHKRDALQFIERVRRAFSVPKENMLCAGDECDSYFGSRFDHSPDASHTPNSEIAAALDELKRWYAMWPQMKLATSNHGLRWVKKALGAQIPSQLLRGYREVLQAPEGWRWADTWRIEGKQPFLMEHGHNGPQGFGGLRLRPLQNGISTVWGHQHANAGIAHVVTSGQKVWGMCVGSLIDVESYAFEYDRGNQYRPWVGCAVVLDGGTVPVLIPYERP